jgi:peptidoglycan hydrolase CwlO-like protein
MINYQFTTQAFVVGQKGGGKYDVQAIYGVQPLLTEYKEIETTLVNTESLVKSAKAAVDERMEEITAMQEVLESLIATRVSAQQADKVNEALAERDKANSDMNYSQGRVDRLQESFDTLQEQIDPLEEQISHLEELLEGYAGNEELIEQTQTQIDELQAEVDELQEDQDKVDKKLKLAQEELEFYTRLFNEKDEAYNEIMALGNEEEFNASVKRISTFIAFAEEELREIRREYNRLLLKKSGLETRKNYIYTNWMSNRIEDVICIKGQNLPINALVELITVQGYASDVASQIEEQHKLINETQLSIAQSSDSIVKLYAQIAPLKNKLNTLSGKLSSVNSAWNFWKRQLKIASERVENLEQSVDENNQEIDKLQADLGEAQAVLTDLLDAEYQDEEAIEAQEDVIAELNDNLIDLQEHQKHLTGELQAATMDVSDKSERVESSASEKSDLEDSIESVRGEIDELVEKQEEWQEKIEAAETLIQNAITTISGLKNKDKYFISTDASEYVESVETVSGRFYSKPDTAGNLSLQLYSTVEQTAIMKRALSLSPAQLFFNYAILPGWQKFLPTYRTGTINFVYRNDNQELCCDVTLEPRFSECQNLDINKTTELTKTPFDSSMLVERLISGIGGYYFPVQWDDTNFGAKTKRFYLPKQVAYNRKNDPSNFLGKRCLVVFKEQDWEQPVVIWVDGLLESEYLCLGVYLDKYLTYSPTKQTFRRFQHIHKRVIHLTEDGIINGNYPLGDYTKVPLREIGVSATNIAFTFLLLDEPKNLEPDNIPTYINSDGLTLKEIFDLGGPWKVNFYGCPLIAKNGNLVVCSYKLKRFYPLGDAWDDYELRPSSLQGHSLYQILPCLEECTGYSPIYDFNYASVDQYIDDGGDTILGRLLCSTKQEILNIRFPPRLPMFTEYWFEDVLRKRLIYTNQGVSVETESTPSEHQFCLQVFAKAIQNNEVYGAGILYNSVLPKPDPNSKKSPITLKKEKKKILAETFSIVKPIAVLEVKQETFGLVLVPKKLEEEEEEEEEEKEDDRQILKEDMEGGLPILGESVGWVADKDAEPKDKSEEPKDFEIPREAKDREVQGYGLVVKSQEHETGAMGYGLGCHSEDSVMGGLAMGMTTTSSNLPVIQFGAAHCPNTTGKTQTVALCLGLGGCVHDGEVIGIGLGGQSYANYPALTDSFIRLKSLAHTGATPIDGILNIQLRHGSDSIQGVLPASKATASDNEFLGELFTHLTSPSEVVKSFLLNQVSVPDEEDTGLRMITSLWTTEHGFVAEIESLLYSQRQKRVVATNTTALSFSLGQVSVDSQVTGFGKALNPRPQALAVSLRGMGSVAQHSKDVWVPKLVTVVTLSRSQSIGKLITSSGLNLVKIHPMPPKLSRIVASFEPREIPKFFTLRLLNLPTEVLFKEKSLGKSEVERGSKARVIDGVPCKIFGRGELVIKDRTPWGKGISVKLPNGMIPLEFFAVKTKVTLVENIPAAILFSNVVTKVMKLDESFLKARGWAQGADVVSFPHRALTYNASFQKIYPATKIFARGNPAWLGGNSFFSLAKSGANSREPVGLESYGLSTLCYRIYDTFNCFDYGTKEDGSTTEVAITGGTRQFILTDVEIYSIPINYDDPEEIVYEEPEEEEE